MEDEINFNEIFLVMMKYRKMISCFALICMFFGVLYSLSLKPVYEARSRILFRQTNQLVNNNSFAGLAAIAGMSFPAGSGSADTLGELLDSRYIKDNATIEASKISGVIVGEKTPPAEVKSKITGSYLELSVKYKNPFYAKALNDSYIGLLSDYWNRLNASEAQKKLGYISKEMPEKQAALIAAEDKLKSLMYLTDENGAVETVDILRAKREIEILNSVYAMLRKEYEQARLEEAKEISPFSDVEYATVPKAPESRRTGLNAVMGLIIGLLGGSFTAFFIESSSKRKKS